MRQFKLDMTLEFCLCACGVMPENISFFKNEIIALAAEAPHPILKPYIDKIVFNEQSDQYFSKPYFYSCIGKTSDGIFDQDFLNTLTPPLQIYKDNVLIPHEMDKLGADFGIQTLYYTGFIGVLKLLLFGIKEKVFCSHLNCPLFKTHMCQNFYYIPEDYETCTFHSFLKNLKMDLIVNFLVT